MYLLPTIIIIIASINYSIKNYNIPINKMISLLVVKVSVILVINSF